MQKSFPVLFAGAIFIALFSLPLSLGASDLPNLQTKTNTFFYNLPLEELMNVKIVTATKSLLKVMDAPSAVTVITREEIQRYGYQTLTDALARVPEVYTRFEGHNFGTDFRGFFFNNTHRRILFLINGHRINDRFHFGDFYPDLIADLSDVERIEVIRGPGAALYGNNAILGVVNIITWDASHLGVKETEAGGSVSVDYLEDDSAVYKYQADLRHRFSDRCCLSFNMYWFDGDIRYDTETTNFERPWQSSETPGSPGKADINMQTDFYLDVPDEEFDGGHQIPSYNFRFGYGDFTLGSFVHSKLVSWVWPKENVTFNHPENFRSWGTGAVFLEWQPEKSVLAEYELKTRISYNVNTNREIADYSTADQINDMSLSKFRLTTIFDGPRWLKNQDGSFFDYTSTLNPQNFEDAAADANGGGSQFNYAGTDKTVGFEFQCTPFKTDSLNIQAGGNYENARYENLQWYAYRNGEFIGWAPWGGITDNGWYAGGWLQGEWHATRKLSFIAGARYDYQEVESVYRQLGGELLYQQVEENQEIKYIPVKRVKSIARDFTPRIALNYYLNNTDNIRLIYARAFRAVPPQELIRLPWTVGDAESEETENYEIIGSFNLMDHLNMTLNAFYIESNITYQWNPEDAAFSKGSGWRNTGGSIELSYRHPKGFEQWFNATVYRLRRPTDALKFMADLPNQYEPLDSPETLVKSGASYRTQTGTTLAAEMYYNSSTTIYVPAVNNIEDSLSDVIYEVYEVPSSLSINCALRQDFSYFGLNGMFGLIKVENIFDTDTWYGLNMDAQQSWDYHLYARPNQLPGFGRRFYVQLGYRF